MSHDIEVTPGSRKKYKYDEKLGLFLLRKELPHGASFPYDFGFIPGTRGGDGDPLDILVLTDEPAFPGCLVRVRLIGVIEAEQTEKGKTERNDRLIGVIETPYNPPEAQSLSDLPDSRLDELEHFFVSYNQAEARVFKPLGRRGAKVAQKLVEEGVRQFESSKQPAR